MLKVNDSIRNAYKQKTTQRKSYIKVGDNSFFIQNLDVSADAYDEGNVIGNAIAKIAKFDIETEYIKGLDDFELFDGIWTGEKYEYVSLGTFKLFEEQGTDEFFSSITSYDKLVLFNKPYDNTNVSFPISLYDFLKEICSQANVELETKRIANGDKILFQNLFVEGETLKQILKAICQISGNFAKIKNDKLVLGLYDYDSYIATGNEIVLEDVVEEKTKIKQYGYTKQNVYSGKNLFDISKVPNTSTITNQGETLLISKTYYNHSGKKLSELAPNLEVGKTYFLNLETSNGGNQFIYLVGTNVSWLKGLTRTITQTDLDSYVAFYGTADVDVIISKIQIEPGDTFTGYEPYVGGKASPSPDYPQEIEVATGSVSVKSTGKNLFNIKNMTSRDNLIVNEDETITLKAQYNNRPPEILSKLAPNLKIGEEYTLSFETTSAIKSMYLDNAKVYWEIGKSLVITQEMLESHPYFYGSADKEDTISKIQIEPGKVATDYEPYKESSIQYHLGDNFLSDKDYIEDGLLNKNVGKIVLNGSEGWTTNPVEDFYYHSVFDLVEGVKPNVNQKCSHYTYSENAKLNSFKVSNGGIFLRDNFATNEEFKTWLSENPVTVYYELATPEQIPLETTGELRTFEPNTIITNDLDSEMEVEYGKYIEIDKDELYQPEYKRTTWKLNKVVLGMKDVEGEFVAKQDDEDVNANGAHQLVINDNPFVYTQQLREEYIDQLFERIKGFGYVAFESGFEGVPYYELGDLIKIEDKKSIILRYNLQSPKGLESTFSAPSIIDSVVEYTQTPNVLEQKIRSTELRVDKAEGNIIGITKQTTEIRDNLNKNYYTIEQANTLIQNAETGVTNTFSEAGGNNVFRNTGLWFANSGEDAETNPYEFWDGKANEGDNDKATNYRSILLGKGSFIQDAEVPNGNYSISFYYQLLNENAIASVVINDKEYPLDSLEVKQFYTGEQDAETGEYIVDPLEVTNNHIKIEFKCDALNGVEVYDLMCNKGSVKLAYSQNQNETTTSTVNISQGITITSSADKNTKFKADYDGIRVLDGNNNPKTKFTDKGTETDELLVRRKATITGLLQQEVDDQTWVTKI